MWLVDVHCGKKFKQYSYRSLKISGAVLWVQVVARINFRAVTKFSRKPQATTSKIGHIFHRYLRLFGIKICVALNLIQELKNNNKNLTINKEVITI